MRSHFAEEAGAGFPRLSRTPNSLAVRFLDYVASLQAAERESFLDELARGAALRFFHPQLVMTQYNHLRENPVLGRYGDAIRSARFTMGLRYWGLPLMKPMLTDPMSIRVREETLAKLDFTPRDDLPETLVPNFDVRTLQPAKAPLLRKLIDKPFQLLFATEKTKHPGGEIRYSGMLEATPLTVTISFPGRGLQLLHWVTIPDETRRVWCSRIKWEDLWSIGHGWDYLTEENAPASVDLLCEQIVLLVRLRNLVAALPPAPAPE